MKFSTSKLFVTGSALALSGFVALNLVACGGGGGGGLGTGPQSTIAPVAVQFQILNQNGSPAAAGTATLTANGKAQTLSVSAQGIASVASILPGTYPVTFTANNSGGTPVPTTANVTISSVNGQTYALIAGASTGGGFLVSGTVFSNPAGSNQNTLNCNANSLPVTATVMVEVRDLDPSLGSPIIGSTVLPQGSNGQYVISVPFQPQTFDVEVAPAPNDTGGAQFAGKSALNTFVASSTRLSSVNVCANSNGVIPVPASTSTPIPTTVGTGAGTPIFTPQPSATTVGTLVGSPSPSPSPIG